MFITILDYAVGQVFQYNYIGEFDEDGNPTDQSINEALAKGKHDVTTCCFMIHDDSTVYRYTFNTSNFNELIEY